MSHALFTPAERRCKKLQATRRAEFWRRAVTFWRNEPIDGESRRALAEAQQQFERAEVKLGRKEGA